MSMDSYVEIVFANVTPEQSELLIATLSEEGYEGFEETGNDLKAFIASNNWNESIVKNLNVEFSKSIIEPTNWNEVWESNFQPVIVDDFVGIRADFHSPIKNIEHEIVITPKMSFGTGHHATTFMMIRQMRSIDFNNKSVCDFGTGTGVLAILAQKLGASSVVAIDNDDWSIDNARENILQNHSSSIELVKADSVQLNQPFDVILANINKNVILDNFGLLTKHLAPKGVLLISGLLTTDEQEITDRANTLGLTPTKRLEMRNWLALRLSQH